MPYLKFCTIRRADAALSYGLEGEPREGKAFVASRISPIMEPVGTESECGVKRAPCESVVRPSRHQAAASTAFLTACGNAIARKKIFGYR